MQAHAMHHESLKRISLLTDLYSKGKSKRLLFSFERDRKTYERNGTIGFSVCCRNSKLTSNYINSESLSSKDSGKDPASKSSPANGLITFFAEAPVHKPPEHGVRFTGTKQSAGEGSCSTARRSCSRSSTDTAQHSPHTCADSSTDRPTFYRLFGHLGACISLGALL
jgi:hypothetical protein